MSLKIDLAKVKSPALKTILTDIEGKNNTVCSIWDKVDADQKGEPTSEQKADVVKLNKQIEELEKRATDLQEGEIMRAAAEERKSTIAALRLPVASEGKGDKGDQPGQPSDQYRIARKSLGRRVLEDKDFKAWQEAIAEAGGISTSSRFQSPSVKVASLITGSGDTSGGALIQIDYKPLVDNAPFKPLTILDLITRGETGSDIVEYPRLLGYTNNAAPVGEATAVGNGTGIAPLSGMDMDKVETTVKAIKHYIAATSRSLADAGQLRTLIDSFLIFGIDDTLEQQVMSGDGTGDNLLGIRNTPGLQSQAFVTDLITTTRKARTKCKTPARVTPTAYAMNPLDWETFDLLKDDLGRYYWGGPSILGNPRLWGLPVVETENIPEGEAMVGAWLYAILWDRMQTMISASNGVNDFFLRGLVAILAEMRAAFGLTYPKAMVDIALS